LNCFCAGIIELILKIETPNSHHGSIIESKLAVSFGQVKQLVKKPISWLRMRDGHILTVDQTTFIADQRFQSVFSPNPERWSLQIKYVQLKDEGTYECQVSTEPKASAIVHLRIVGE